MSSFDCLGDPVRRRILGLRANGGRATEDVSLLVQPELEAARSAIQSGVLRSWEAHVGGITQHRPVLRDHRGSTGNGVGI
jgi:hypothetical protein